MILGWCRKLAWFRKLVFELVRVLQLTGLRSDSLVRWLFDAAYSVGARREAMRYGTEGLASLDLERLTKLAQLQFESDDLEAAANSFRARYALKSAPSMQVRVCRESFLDDRKAASGDAYVKTVENVLVDTDYWAVMDGSKVYVRDTYARTFYNSPLVGNRRSADGKSYIVSFPAPSQHLDEPCVFIGSDGNYSHWLLRGLLKLSLLEGVPGLETHRYLVRDDLQSFHKEYLDILGISDAQLALVSAHSIVECAKLHVPTQLAGNRHAAPAIEWLRAKVADLLAPEEEATDLLFLSRRDSSTRVLVNESEIYDALRPYGFRLAVPGEMSVREQIGAFSRARVVVAAHGAGLTNMIFSPRTCGFVEIANSYIAPMVEFRWLAKLRGQAMTTLVSDDYAMDDNRRQTTKPVNWDFRVSPQELLAAVLKQHPELR